MRDKRLRVTGSCHHKSKSGESGPLCAVCKRAARASGVVVVLAACVNVDRPWEAGAPATFVAVADVGAAALACRQWIVAHGIGGGAWTGGQVWHKGLCIANVSYNGRVWDAFGEILPIAAEAN